MNNIVTMNKASLIHAYYDVYCLLWMEIGAGLGQLKTGYLWLLAMKMAVTGQGRPWALVGSMTGTYGQMTVTYGTVTVVAWDRDIWDWNERLKQAATGRSQTVLTLVSEWNGTLGLEQPGTTRNRELWNQGNGFDKVHIKNLWVSSDRNITGRELSH